LRSGLYKSRYKGWYIVSGDKTTDIQKLVKKYLIYCFCFCFWD